MRTPVDPSKRAFSRELRRSMTREEKHVWYDCLKRLSYTFCRQKPIGKYIVDFFCAEAALVIEIDGSQHYSESGRDNDAERDGYLSSVGLEVVRYSNHDVNTNFEGVYNDISRRLAERITDKK